MNTILTKHRRVVARGVTLITAASAVLLLAACSSLGIGGSSTPKSEGADTADTLSQGATLISQAREQLVKVGASLNLLLQPDNLAEHYKIYVDQVSQLSDIGKKIESNVADLHKQGQSYFAKWEKDIASIQNPDLKQASTDRLNRVKEKVATIQSDYSAVKTTATAYMADLNDIKTALGADLTPGGVEKVKPFINKANSDAISMKAAAETLSSTFEQAGQSLKSSLPAETPPASK